MADGIGERHRERSVYSHRPKLIERFTKIVDQPDGMIDVARAAMLLAASEYPDLNIERELFSFQRIAGSISSRFLDDNDPLYCMNTLSEYLFDDLGFVGNTDNYYDPRNSYLNEVLSRRLGIPITLAVIYMEVGRRLRVPLLGVGMPGHFLVRHAEIDNLFVDPFHGGILLSANECRNMVEDRGADWNSEMLHPVSNRETVARILRNLREIYMHEEDYVRALEMADFALALDPNSAICRLDRGIVHYQLGHSAEALDDLAYYLDTMPNGPDIEGIHALVAELRSFLDD